MFEREGKTKGHVGLYEDALTRVCVIVCPYPWRSDGAIAGEIRSVNKSRRGPSSPTYMTTLLVLADVTLLVSIPRHLLSIKSFDLHTEASGGVRQDLYECYALVEVDRGKGESSSMRYKPF
jgi:hypothetical protein